MQEIITIQGNVKESSFLQRTTIYPLARGLTGHYVLQVKENKDEKKCTVIFERTVIDTKEDRDVPKKYYSLDEINELSGLLKKIKEIV